MDDNQFDRIAKWMSTRRSRRDAVRALAAGAIGGATAMAGVDGALAGKPVKPDCCPANAPKLCGDPFTCTSVASDPNHCGGCEVSCPAVANASPTCVNGNCGFTCNAGFANCNGVCVDTQTSMSNCGTCGQTCPSGTTCTAGSCKPTGPTCNDNAKNGNETDVDCGGGTCPPCAGGKACLGDSDCVAGLFCINHTCTACQAGQQACNNICVSVQTDPNNCGACGATCSISNGTASCVAGTCHVGACNAGFADCDNLPSNGCEVNILNDSNNCGACGHVCGSGMACVNGACVGSQCSTPTDCPPTGSECAVATCNNQLCGTTFAAANTPTISGQTPGDCHLVVCDGSGGTMNIIDNSDLPIVANQICATGVCSAGNASYSYANTSTVCSTAACIGDIFQPASNCDGVGNCSPATQVQCLPGTCTLNGCTA